MTLAFYVHALDVVGRSIFPMRTSLMIAISILGRYNANHPGKLNDYIELHMFDSVPTSGLNLTFREMWGCLGDIHPNSLPMHCPDIIFKMMSIRGLYLRVALFHTMILTMTLGMQSIIR